MGSALLSAWLEVVPASQITVIEPHAAAVPWDGVKLVASIAEITDVPNIIIFAVKPQIIHEILPDYRKFISPDTLFVSIAAGKTLRFFEQHLGDKAAVVRAMPNLPAVVAKGATVLCHNALVTLPQQHVVAALFDAVGQTYITEESHMDAVTALSGSGPAYLFLLAEVMTKAGIELGLPASLAEKLAEATVYGSGELLHRSDQASSVLRQQVTSPGGTTAAALAVLMKEKAGLQSLMDEAMRAAHFRSQELAE